MLPHLSTTKVSQLLRHEALSGMLLVFCALAAMVVANSPLSHWYESFLHETTGIIGVGAFVLEKHIIHWINDGLMAVFFFLIGLEVKRELTEGLLSTWSQRVLPGFAAIGGMAGPALVYFLVIAGYENANILAQGWAIPAATDIAFALGVFALLGKRLPTSLKVFLLALAIFDDVGAIIVIALFYTVDLGVVELVGALGCFAILLLMNFSHVSKPYLYIMVGLVMWAFVLKSGVHATLAGVLLAFTIPMHAKNSGKSIVKTLEHDLHSIVNFFVLPVFAFANAGVSLQGFSVNMLLSPLTLAVALGLIVGKQVGILSTVWVVVKFNLAKMPKGSSWFQVWGITMLAGIGFTMSLFIGSLAFPAELSDYRDEVKLGILLGSFISAIAGLWVLWASCRKTPQKTKGVQT